MPIIMKRNVLLAILLQPFFYLIAGNQPKDTTLFNYGNKRVSVQEFYKGFTKNKHKDSGTSVAEVEEYLELYKKFKLKVQDAYDMGLDTTEGFIAELATYRKQIAKPYLTDKVVNDKLVNEAYERMQYDIKASHILVFARPDASPEDTLKAYNQMLKVKKEIESGAITFENAALKYSEDPSAGDNQGSLGYFTAFQMIYEFENQAFKTPVGKVSNVFKTEFGYHIVKVFDKRLSKGDVTVRQIMLDLNPNPGQEEIAEARAKINEVYKKLKNGEKFEHLVQQYSEDASSVLKNGIIPPFSMTSMRPENYKNTAFSLAKDEDFSEPIQTADGFYILQRVSLKPIDSLYKLKNTILSKIARDSRQYRNTLAVFEKAKKTYKFKENKKYKSVLMKAVDSSLLIGEFTPNESQRASKLFRSKLFTLKSIKKDYTVNDFSDWLQTIQRPSNSKSLSSIIDNYYQAFRMQTIMEFYEYDLENINDTFAALYKEYKEGILLFTLTDQKVWSKSVEDTTGLKAFFNKNTENYYYGDRYETTIFRCANKEIAESLQVDLKNGLTIDSIMKKTNSLNPLNISNPMSGKYEKGNNSYANMLFEAGVKNEKYYMVEDPKSKGGYVVFQIHKFIPSVKKTLNEARGSAMSDYQGFLEKEWINKLSEKYPIVLNKEAFEAVKSRLVNSK
jgi:peptidyl-prolyl cis-trans isomerase SurA